ncbi:zinc finger CCCH domain-containing protein 14 [Dorcoceras hygrometricum]|uniref:Zinc finger CCCH domain-containing protein 14 n=1 Tax=Dorcoceras hygrometricum TaxID=472368 RepID=A0A2Z7D1S4_9LAMI|nr:zinc finger CCCH domain-containing protein 14 [Dorcoceras hygrometricum]
MHLKYAADQPHVPHALGAVIPMIHPLVSGHVEGERIAGCPFGENCHFLHYVPGGYNAVAKMMNLAPSPAPRTMAPPPSTLSGSAPAAVKTKICNKFNSAEGCRFGDKCHFAHGEWELGKPNIPFQEDPRVGEAIPGRFGARVEPSETGPAASFGVSATAKISVDASFVGAILGKISRQTGAKLAIREHESDPSLRNIELEGSFEQINQASRMVRELIVSIGSTHIAAKPYGGPFGGFGRGSGGAAAAGGNFKTKLCDNFSKGSCTFGDRCHFAHGEAELRKSVM